MGVTIANLFAQQEAKEVNSYDKSLIEKLRLVDQLEEQEKKTIFSMIDIALTKKRLKDTLSNALNLAQ